MSVFLGGSGVGGGEGAGREGRREVKMRFRRGYVWRFCLPVSSRGEVRDGNVQGHGEGHERGNEEEGRRKGGVSLWFIKPGTGTVSDAAKSDPGGEGGAGGGAEVDYLFHEVEVLVVEPADAEGDGDGDGDASAARSDREGDVDGNVDGDVCRVKAKGQHLCVDDVYSTEYVFTLRSRSSSSGRQESEPGDAGPSGVSGGWELEKWEVTHTVTGPKKEQRIWSLYERERGGR